MSDSPAEDAQAIIERLRRQIETDAVRVTTHAHGEMIEENVTLEEVRDVLRDATLVENYPAHKRGPCCLVCGYTSRRRYLHLVCTTSLELAIIITVYEPSPPKWTSPFERGVKG